MSLTKKLVEFILILGILAGIPRGQSTAFGSVRTEDPTYRVLMIELPQSGPTRGAADSDARAERFAKLKQSFVWSGVPKENIYIMSRFQDSPLLFPTRNNILNMVDMLGAMAFSRDTLVILLDCGDSPIYADWYRTWGDDSSLLRKKRCRISTSDIVCELALSNARKNYLFVTATGTLPAPKDFDKVSCGLPLSDKQLEGISDKPVIVTVKPVGTSSSRSAQTGDNIFPLAHLLVAGRETLAPEFRLAPLLSRLSGTKPVVEYRLRDSVLAIMELQAKENASQKESAAKKEAAKKVSAAPEKVILAGTRYLISLGISNYKNKISSITNAANDSEVVRSCFVDHCYVNLGNSICLSDSSVDNYNLNNLFCNYVPKLIRPGDPVFIYLSGHSGKVKPTKNQTVVPGDVYFVPQDGNPDDPEKTFLKMSTFASWLKKNYSKNPVVLILDFCWWAGSDKEANRTLFAPFAGLDNVAVIVPDVAWESSGTDSQSLLVQALCESIQNDHPRTHKDLFESMKKKYKEKVSKEHKEPGNLLFFNSMKKDLIIVP